jgi:hypothetical protein
VTDQPTIIERGAEASTYVGAATTTALWGLSVSEWAVTISAVFAGLSFAVHVYFSWRRDRREADKAQRELARHQLMMENAHADTPADGDSAP